MTKKPLALFTALMAGTLALPALAQQAAQGQQPGMQNQQGQMSIRVGHNVVDAVDDVRETVVDLIGSLRQSGEVMGLPDWQQGDSQLAQMEQRLQQMEQTLDQKAERVDEGWLTWLTGNDYKVTVTDQVNSIASTLNDIATMLATGQGGANMQQVIGADLVDQVDDVRETVEDLANALNNSEAQFAWFNNTERFPQIQQRLEQMEQELDRKAEMTDEEWGVFVTDPEFSTFVHGNIYELAQIMQSLFSQGS